MTRLILIMFLMTPGMATYLWCQVANLSDPVETQWSEQIVQGLGEEAEPTLDQRKAVIRFCRNLRRTKLLEKFYFINIMLPGRLDRMLYPLVNAGHYPGLSPWINNNFTEDDLTLNGLQGDATTKYLETGYQPGLNASYDDCGLTAMRSEVSLYHQFCEMELGCMYQDTDYLLSFRISGQSELIDVGLHDLWGPFGHMPDFNTAVYAIHDNVKAFVSMSRVAPDDLRLYWGYQGQPLDQLDLNTNVPPVDFLPNVTLYAMATHWVDPILTMTDQARFFNGSRCSFLAFHRGFSLNETRNLYRAVQQLRNALGGGSV